VVVDTRALERERQGRNEIGKVEAREPEKDARDRHYDAYAILFHSRRRDMEERTYQCDKYRKREECACDEHIVTHAPDDDRHEERHEREERDEVDTDLERDAFVEAQESFIANEKDSEERDKNPCRGKRGRAAIEREERTEEAAE